MTPFTFDFSNIFNIKVYNNYNFAIARVRLRGSSGSAGEAKNMRVFFRLWTAQSPDTDYLTGSTYPSNPDAAGLPASPQVGAGHITLPFFASGNLGANSDYGPGGANTLDIEIPAGRDSTWAYFGCFLNLYDAGNLIDGTQVQGWLNGDHHCLVAQIATDDAPIPSGVSPETSDKLAQRNLQITHSDNPGPASAHVIPQAFDIRPSATTRGAADFDELMIDWGDVPKGTVASIFWPQVAAADVLALASRLYRTHDLAAADAHTLSSKVTGGVTYVPIPAGAGENFAGLFTLALPASVRSGQEFDVLVRRVARRRALDIGRKTPVTADRAGAAAARGGDFSRWRYVTGTFQVKIPVSTAAVMLRPEEDRLAILKWRLDRLAPSNRWRAVLKRYVDQVAGRVLGLGGDPDAIPPSLKGAPIKLGRPCDDTVEYCGKVIEVAFDCFGDFDGFTLEECCERRVFTCREKGLGEIVLRACKERLSLSVFVLRHDHRKIARLVVRA